MAQKNSEHYLFPKTPFIALLLLIIGFSAGFGYAMGYRRAMTGGPTPTPTPDNTVMCTLEAMQCPDGSYVGRVPPTCEFAACPGTSREPTGAQPAGKRAPVNCCSPQQTADGYSCIPDPCEGAQVDTPDNMYQRKYVCMSPEAMKQIDKLNCMSAPGSQ